MTDIYVKGEKVYVSSDMEFEYITENSNFSGNEGYTLSITFPLSGCPENQRVFGHLHRDDVLKDPELMSCEIFNGMFHAKGSLAIVDVNEKECKGQFLEGVDPAHEELDIDTLYINELDLGSYPETDPNDITPLEARTGTDQEVCYPWCAEGYDVINNRAVSADEWHEETTKLSWQPRLITIIDKILTEAGYVADLGTLPTSKYGDLIVCNTLPPVWGVSEYSAALPRWTVREFTDYIGLFLHGTFDYNESQKTVTFKFYSESAVRIEELKNVVDSYSCVVSRDSEDADYLPVKRLRYNDSDMTIWKYLCAPWIHKGGWKISRFADYSEYESAMNTVDSGGHRVSGIGNFIYLEDCDTYFVPRRVVLYSKGQVSEDLSEQYPYASYYELQPVDCFGPPDYEEELEYEDLKICPVIVDYALEGKFMWLPVASTDGNADLGDGTVEPTTGVTLGNGYRLSSDLVIYQTRMEHAIESYSTEDKKNEYFSEIYVGYPSTDVSTRPYPVTDVDVVNNEITGTRRDLRLTPDCAGGISVDPKVKYSFSFLSGSIPDVHSRFLIHGHLYVAQRITATFNEHGMSEILKGEFYRIV